eukprot:524686_1
MANKTEKISETIPNKPQTETKTESKNETKNECKTESKTNENKESKLDDSKDNNLYITSFPNNLLLDRAYGLCIGAAIGDSIGSYCEFSNYSISKTIISIAME